MVTYVEKTTCKNTKCPTNSKCIDLFPAQCRCVHGYVFNVKTSQCTDEDLYTITGLHLDVEFQEEFHDVESLGFLMMANRVEEEVVRVIDTNVNLGVKVIKATSGTYLLICLFVCLLICLLVC